MSKSINLIDFNINDDKLQPPLSHIKIEPIESFKRDIMPDMPHQDNIPSHQIKLPCFWKEEPALWFIHAETIFFNHHINSDDQRYNIILASLNDPTVLCQITDILYSPPKTDKYSSLKALLISRFSESKESQFNKLLYETHLDNKKPSQLLREMLNLGASETSEDLIRALWLNRLPTSVKCILSVVQDIKLTKLADMADQIFEHSTSGPYVQAFSKSTTSGGLEERITKIEEQLKLLTTSINKTHVTDTSHMKDLKPSKISESNRRNICFYHKKFKSRANKCVQP